MGGPPEAADAVRQFLVLLGSSEIYRLAQNYPCGDSTCVDQDNDQDTFSHNDTLQRPYQP